MENQIQYFVKSPCPRLIGSPGFGRRKCRLVRFPAPGRAPRPEVLRDTPAHFQRPERAALPLFNALTGGKCAFKIWQGGVLEIAGLGAAAMGFEKENNKGLLSLLNESQA